MSAVPDDERLSVAVPLWVDAFVHQTTVPRVARHGGAVEPGAELRATCTTKRPAARCSCGRYSLVWEDTGGG